MTLAKLIVHAAKKGVRKVIVGLWKGYINDAGCGEATVIGFQSIKTKLVLTRDTLN